ncbi:MAG: ABC transporter substrate-binding protein [Anaerolineales bacterium]
MKSKYMLRGFTIMALVIVVSIVAGACATPTPQTVEVVVTKEVEVVKTVEVEKEVPVEKQVEVLITPTPAPLPEGGVKTIPFMTTESDPDSVALYQEIIAEYEADHPDVRIDLVLTAHGSEEERLITANAVGAELGIVGIHPESLIDYVAAGYLLPLDSVVDDIGRDKFKTGAVLSTGGHDYAMGYAAGNNATLWVRTDLLDAAGLGIPTNYDELLAAAKAMTKDTNGDGKIDVYGWGAPAAANGATWLRFNNFIWQNCGEYFDKQGNLAFDNPNVLEALKRYVALLEYAPPDVSGWSWYDGIIAMTAETVAMHPYGGRLGFNIWRDKPELRKNIKVIWGPYGDVVAGEGGYDYNAISANVRWPEEAKDFLKFFYTGDRLARFDMTVPGHLIPPTVEIQEAMMAMDNEYANEYADDLKVLFDTANNTASAALFMGALETDTCTFNPVYNPMPWGGEIFGASPIEAQMVEKVVVGGMSPEEAWKWAYTEMQRIADEWKAEHPDWVPPLGQ